MISAVHMTLSRNGGRRLSTRLLLVSTVTLYASTCTYFAVSIADYVNAYAYGVSYAYYPMQPLPTP